jgi:hypothetical protein
MSEGTHKIKLRIIGHSLGAGVAGAIFSSSECYPYSLWLYVLVATTALELRKNPGIATILGEKVTIDVVGFGCPAVMSEDIGCEEFVTNVINDGTFTPRILFWANTSILHNVLCCLLCFPTDDIIPRTSIATLRNLIHDVSLFDWTERAGEDIEDALTALQV